MKKNILFLILIVLFLTSFSSLTFASNTIMTAADFLVQIGELSYEKGNIEDAIREFNKALLLDPRHPKALQYLNQAGYSQNLYSRQPTAVERVDELTREVELYRQMLADVENQRQEINVQLKQLTMEHQDVLLDNRAKDEKLKSVQSQVEQMGVRLNHAQTFENIGFSQIRPQDDRRSFERDSAGIIEQINAPMMDENVSANAQLNKKISETLDVALVQEDQLLALNRENRTFNKDLQLQQSAQQNMLELMEDYLYVQQVKMSDLGNQSVISSVDLAEKHKQLLDKTEALNQSNHLIETVANAMDQREAVIQQRNLQIDDLQKRLEWYQKNFEVPANL